DVVAVRNLQVLLDVVHMPLIQRGILVQISRSAGSEPLRGVIRGHSPFGVAADSNTLWNPVKEVRIRGCATVCAGTRIGTSAPIGVAVGGSRQRVSYLLEVSIVVSLAKIRGLGDKDPAEVGFCLRLARFRLVLQEVRNGDRRQNPDNGHHDHQFDEGEAFLITKLQHWFPPLLCPYLGQPTAPVMNFKLSSRNSWTLTGYGSRFCASLFRC